MGYIKIAIVSLTLIPFFIQCGNQTPKKIDTPIKNEAVMEKSSDQKNEKAEITGIAYDRKGGAVIVTDSIHYWMDNRDYWEDKYLNRKLTVNGYIQIRGDNPVFVDTSEVKSQGIPVSSEEEAEANKFRYWIVDAQILSAE